MVGNLSDNPQISSLSTKINFCTWRNFWRKIENCGSEFWLYKITEENNLSIPVYNKDLEIMREYFQDNLREIRDQEKVIIRKEKEDDELIEFTKTLKTLGLDKIWKQFSFPVNFDEIGNYLKKYFSRFLFKVH